MFAKKNINTDPDLIAPINKLLDELKAFSAEDDEYAKMMNQLEKLYKLKELDKPKQVSPDTLLIVSANIIGIILIVGHERANVVTSKAVNFLLKLR